MLTLFLAGGIASGKSTVAKRLAQLGARRCDLDQLSREVLLPGSPLLPLIARRFGEDLINPETGELDRSLLASRAFATSDDAADLEALQHPAILDLMRKRIDEARAEQDAPPVFAVEIPLLGKMGSAIELADVVMAVTCPFEMRRRLAIARGMDEADFEARLALQPTDDELVALADVVIENNDTLEHLIDQVDSWWISKVA